MNIADIINKGIAAGKSYEEINKELAAAGCAFRLVETGKSGLNRKLQRDLSRVTSLLLFRTLRT